MRGAFARWASPRSSRRRTTASPRSCGRSLGWSARRTACRNANRSPQTLVSPAMRGINHPMSLGEQLNELDRKVLGAAPVDRTEPAAPYRPAVGELAPLGRTLSIRAAVYGLGALVLGLHMVLGGNWKTLL